MWLIFKVKNRETQLFINDLKKKIGIDLEVYFPKIKTKKIKNNSFRETEHKLLGDYIFCFNKKFSDLCILNQIKYCKGFKHLLSGCFFAQKDIIKFINYCKKNETKDGFLSFDFFRYQNHKDYKILSGPFLGQIAKIINEQKDKISLAFGNIKVSIGKENLFIKPI